MWYKHCQNETHKCTPLGDRLVEARRFTSFEFGDRKLYCGFKRRRFFVRIFQMRLWCVDTSFLNICHITRHAHRASHTHSHLEREWFWKEPRCIFPPPIANKCFVPCDLTVCKQWPCFFFHLFKTDKQMMEGDSIWGSKDYFADVIDECSLLRRRS